MKPLLFIDTEFNDLVEMDLISLGVVTDDGRSWYAERTDFNERGCSAFVREAVLPHLGRDPDRAMSFDEMSEDLLRWLSQFKECGAVICYDYVGDWALFVELIGDVPTWIKTRNVRGQLDPSVLESYFALTGLPRHHALYDATANKEAFRRKE